MPRKSRRNRDRSPGRQPTRSRSRSHERASSEPLLKASSSSSSSSSSSEPLLKESSSSKSVPTEDGRLVQLWSGKELDAWSANSAGPETVRFAYLVAARSVTTMLLDIYDVDTLMSWSEGIANSKDQEKVKSLIRAGTLWCALWPADWIGRTSWEVFGMAPRGGFNFKGGPASGFTDKGLRLLESYRRATMTWNYVLEGRRVTRDEFVAAETIVELKTTTAAVAVQ